MAVVSPMRLELYCAWKSCGHSRCPNRIGSYVEQLVTTWSQVLSIDAWTRMGTRLIPYPRPRPGDGRRKDRTRTDPKPKCSHHISPSLYMPWTVARLSPMVTGSLGQRLIKNYCLNGI
ncbi:UNVERIFIED_CONTAM: hypothetical protein Slati_0147600 [Sesamum latifolium]|uniref:Uncharacterized protein n=1 Tax=Sesamum latifolium TaxID=2727402 RepID=A0AAW2YAX0_9LAMI